MPQERKYAAGRHRQAAYRRRKSQALLARDWPNPAFPRFHLIPTMPGHARWNAALDRSVVLITAVKEEMEECVNEPSDAWQEGERAEVFQARIQELDEILDALGSLSG